MWKKRIIPSVSAALLAFSVGVASSRILLHHEGAPHHPVAAKRQVPTCPMPSDLQEILNVEYCDLMADPKCYDGRMVRFNAVMLAHSGYEPIYDQVSLGEPRCERELWVHDQFHLTSRTCPALWRNLIRC